MRQADNTKSRQLLDENAIKCMLIDWLFEQGQLEDAVLINEMVVGGFSRRADIALANGKLMVFEIKSDFDTLRRLPGQLEAYQQRFDKVTIVTTPRFAKEVADSSCKTVEILEASVNASGQATLRTVRRGKTREIRTKALLASFLTKVDIVTMLKASGITASTNQARDDLLAAIEKLSIKDVRASVLMAIKARYKKSFLAFLEARTRKTLKIDLPKLSRFRTLPVSRSQSLELKSSLSIANRKPIDLHRLAERWGSLPAEMPTYVLTKPKA